LSKERALKGLQKDDLYYRFVTKVIGLDESASVKDVEIASSKWFSNALRNTAIKALGLSVSATDEEIDKAQKTPEGGRLVRRAMLGGITDEELTIFERDDPIPFPYSKYIPKESIFASEGRKNKKRKRRRRLRKRKCSSCRNEFKKTGIKPEKCIHKGINLS